MDEAGRVCVCVVREIDVERGEATNADTWTHCRLVTHPDTQSNTTNRSTQTHINRLTWFNSIKTSPRSINQSFTLST